MTNALTSLELDGVISILRRYVSSPLGQARIDDVAENPLLSSIAAAELALAETAEAMDWLREHESADRRNLTPLPRFQGLRDLSRPAELLSTEGSVLEAPDLYGLVELLDRAEETRQRLWRERTRRPLLGGHGDHIEEFAPLVRRLSGKILPNGDVADHASSGLARVRRQLERQRQDVQESLQKFVRKHYDEGVLQDDYATVRNDRAVVPVKASFKGRIEGVVHAASSTAQTVFVEPLETITQNNKLVRLLDEEHQEIFRILREMTEALREQADGVQGAVRELSALEVIFAKARFGIEFRCCCPRFSDGELKLDWARHPLLIDVLGREGRKVTPLSVELVGGRRVLVVSGPNAGGKTVVLKTVGLLALMAQCGIPVPAEEASMPWFDQVLAAIGDSQSIEASLSTFSAHIEVLKSMLEEARGRSLVIIDELGSATDPQEGGAFAVAVVDHFLSQGAFALVSTHLPALKVYAANRDRIISAAMGFDDNSLSPNYRLVTGTPGKSAGLAMAERLGIPKSVIERAHAALADQAKEASEFVDRLHAKIEEHEAARKSLEASERELREKDREQSRESERREKKRIDELEKRFAKALKQALDENQRALDSALAKIRNAGSSRRAETQAQASASRVQRLARDQFAAASSEALGRKLDDEQLAPVVGELKPGQLVRLRGFGAQGKLVRKLSDERWEVQVGQLKMQVSSDELGEVIEEQPSAQNRLPSGVTFSGQMKSFESLSELNVIGRTVDEAQSEVDKFLDEAALAEVQRLRIIHGHGTHATLRRGLWKMFANHIHVERYYQAELPEGGAGATIVELKD